MAFMDVAPAQPNGRTVVLLHGRNFPASYWEPVIKILSEAGYRVVIPDQIGFGKSSKPQATCLRTLARYTVALMDRLHRQGGYRCTFDRRNARHALRPRLSGQARASVLTAPMGLEDYRLYVPPTRPKILENEDR